MAKIAGSTIPIRVLAEAEKQRMWQLMDNSYLNVTEKKFRKDLEEKSDVILLRDANTGIICGFSTLLKMAVDVEGETVRAIFSGDTIIDPGYWGEQKLVRQIGLYFIDFIKEKQDGRNYWFLISKGYKTYRYLPIYFNTFFPRYDRETPRYEQNVIDALARTKFNGSYDPLRGVLKFGASAECLRPGIADVTEGRMNNPHVRFFCEKNAGHAKGEELVCIAELSAKSLKKIFFRIVGSVLEQKDEKEDLHEAEAVDLPFVVAGNM